MYFLLFYEVVDDFVERRTAIRAPHLEKVEAAHARGEIVMAGALADPVDGALLLFAGPDEGAAERFACEDPYVREGLVTAWRVRKWNVVVGAPA